MKLFPYSFVVEKGDGCDGEASYRCYNGRRKPAAFTADCASLAGNVSSSTVLLYGDTIVSFDEHLPGRMSLMCAAVFQGIILPGG